jgi:maltose alpha-D-glucosyltransferase/alpha-amylase
MKRLLAARKTSPAFGHGSIEFLRPRNRKVLAYLRRYGHDTLLIVNNLSGAPQPVELDLAQCRGATPIELLGQTHFPAVRESPYFLSLGPYAFYWFRLAEGRVGEAPYGIEGTPI